MKLRKILALVLALAMMFALAACGSGSGDSSAGGPAPSSGAQSGDAEGGEGQKTKLTYGVDSEPSTLDPAEATDASAYALFRAVYENLWYYDSEGNLVYQLATGFEYDESETVLTIQLREGVTFHDGSAFTADDVLYTIECIAASAAHSGDVGMIDMNATTAVNDYTVELHLNRVAANLVYTIAQPYWMIRDREFGEANPDNSVTTVENGTGPYTLTGWNIGESFELAAFDGYWGEAPVYQNVSIKFIADEFTRMMEFEAGNLDVAIVSTSSYVDDLSEGVYSGASLIQLANGSVNGIEINMVTPEWAELYGDINLRKALFHAIDVDAILSTITGSTTKKATSILPSSCWAYVDVGSYEYDVEYAKECLAAAGYEPGELTLSLVYQPGTGEIWEAVQAYWKEIGITLEIEGAEPSVWGPAMINGEFAMAIAGAQNCVDPSDAFMPRKTDNGMLPMMWPTDELAELDAAAESVTDQAQRVEYYTQIQQIMHDGYYALPLYESTNNWAVRDGVSGWAESCDGLCVPNLALVG